MSVKKVKNVLPLLLLLLLACNTPQQKKAQVKGKVKSSRLEKIEGVNAYSLTVFTAKDTIEYIKVGSDTSSAKPVLLFLQGSLPRPLIFDLGSRKHINLPFDFTTLTEAYHLVEIAMPNTPVMAGKSHLNSQYCFVTDTADETSYSPLYLKNNYLGNYVNRTKRVIEDLLTKKWVLRDSIHLIGHSQGAKVAAVTAAENNNIASVALLGFNAFGRFDEYIRKERRKLHAGLITGAEYQKNIEQHYEQWRSIHQTPGDFEKGHNAWTTFSIDYRPHLLQINVPVFIGYGTEDLIAENCDLLPLDFIQNGKTNLTLKPYPNLNHNFFELKNGKPDRRNGAHFSTVIDDILNWIDQQ